MVKGDNNEAPKGSQKQDPPGVTTPATTAHRARGRDPLVQDAETTTAASAPWGEETTTRPLMGMNKQEPPGAKRETTSLSSALRAGSIGKPKKKEETTSPLYPWLETPLRAVQKQGIKETYRGTTTGPPAPWMSETTMRPLGPDNKVMKLSKPVAKKQKTPAPSRSLPW